MVHFHELHPDAPLTMNTHRLNTSEKFTYDTVAGAVSQIAGAVIQFRDLNTILVQILGTARPTASGALREAAAGDGA